jgi:hypothetical protein
MNNELERKQSWHNSRYNPSFCLEGMRGKNYNPSQDSQFLGQDFNSGPSKYNIVLLLN